MANLKDIRQRINSVKTTRQVTSAMKMVAAAKLRKAQDAIVQLRPYAGKLYHILQLISRHLEENEETPYTEQREVNRVAMVLLASNRGLCGPFNTNVVREAMRLMNDEYEELYKTGKLQVIVIGKKIEEVLVSKGYRVDETHHDLLEDTSYKNTTALANHFMEAFKNKSYDRVELVYNRFKNAAVQQLSNEQFLPVEVKDSGEEEDYNYDYIFEPDIAHLLHDVLPMTLKTQFYRVVIDSVAAEHGARMTAMHKATDNATDLIRDLTLSYNKARQAQITNEISEIVAGANALGK